MTAKEMAELLGGKLHGDSARDIREVAGLLDAGPDALTYAEGEKALKLVARSRAGLILIPEGAAIEGQTTLAVANPKLAFIRAAEALRPRAVHPPGAHASAVIASDVALPASVSVGPNVVIERGAIIGAGTRLSAGVFVGDGVQIGGHCLLHPRVTLYPGAQLGQRVILHAGVVVGSDGFGYVFADGRHHKFPQLGKVIIEDDVEIGSNTTIDRGSLGTTVIGQGTKIDNLCQIAHNVRIGRHCVIAAQTGISGSTEIGNYVVLGGQCGIADHVRIEDQVMMGGRGAVFPGKIIRKGSAVWGNPVRPLSEYKRINACLSRLPGLIAKVKELEQQQARGRS
ncbi:MAG TPA: UDP-3-O-(3-hydroxymyristoyl)glucosamine N-acyltransferase [Terriglobia bacterium]|nr:UDP-3-O-(3-hydroxymyristoyl)glucosamine N-acyltransferase [Terriglobia bacterium]